MNPVELSIVCALAQNRTIGCDNQLPWRLPKDLAYFKKITLGHPVIMGRKTFASIGRPLPGRDNFVVTTQRNWTSPGVIAVNSLSQALSQATNLAELNNLREVMLIGGASLYKQALPLTQRLYLTEVHADVDGDVFFPEFDYSEWVEKKREPNLADAANPYAYSFVIYERRAAVVQDR